MRRILTKEVARGPVLVREGHIQLTILLNQALKLTTSCHLPGHVDDGLLHYDVQDHLVVVVVVVQGPDGRLSLSLEPLPSIARDADTRACFATTVHRAGWILTDGFAATV